MPGTGTGNASNDTTGGKEWMRRHTAKQIPPKVARVVARGRTGRSGRHLFGGKAGCASHCNIAIATALMHATHSVEYTAIDSICRAGGIAFLVLLLQHEFPWACNRMPSVCSR